jgi:hypothetical protein
VEAEKGRRPSERLAAGQVSLIEALPTHLRTQPGEEVPDARTLPSFRIPWLKRADRSSICCLNARLNQRSLLIKAGTVIDVSHYMDRADRSGIEQM